MAYDEHLEERISQVLREKGISFVAKKMMGGLCYLVDDKMCVGIIKDQLMARLDPEFYQEALQLEGCREMDFTKRPMKGYVYISSEAVDLDKNLDFWISKALEFNPYAKSSKKR